jgi:hypothetical protein
VATQSDISAISSATLNFAIRRIIAESAPFFSAPQYYSNPSKYGGHYSTTRFNINYESSSHTVCCLCHTTSIINSDLTPNSTNPISICNRHSA